MAGSLTAFAQNVKVSGTITDELDEPMIGVSVIEKGTQNGVITDIDGKYEIQTKPGAVLEYSYIGYVTVEKNAINGVLNIQMAPDTEMLEETVVVGYGVQKKSSLTGSVSQVKSEDIENRTITTPESALQGKTAGVQIFSSSARPGASPSVRIRGISSNSSSDPLYVVDGRISSSISGIDPNDIESMEVLKDGASAAIYGARAGNGVILITTRKGQGEGKISYNFQLTSQSISKVPQVMNSEEYMQWYLEDGRFDMEKFYRNWDFKTNTDWIDYSYEPSMMQRHNVTFSAGSDKGSIYVSGTYLNNNGMFAGDADVYERLTGMINATWNIKKWFDISTNNQIERYKVRSVSEGSDYGSAIMGALMLDPLTPTTYTEENLPDFMRDILNQGKTLLKDENGNNVGGYDYGENGRPKASNFNNIADLYDNKYGLNRDNTSARAYLTLGGDKDVMGVLKGLEFTTNFGIDVTNAASSGYYNPYHGDGAQTNGSVEKQNGRTMSWTWNQILKYDRTFVEKHHVLAQAGHEFYNYNYQYLSAERTGVYPGLDELAPSTNVTSNNSYRYDYRIESYFGRLAYDYADKYYFEGTWRTDGSSRFHKDYRWGQFWSVGASWRISEESFMKNVSWIDNMTARLSYGQLGNDALDSYYAWQSFYDLTWANASNPGALVSSLENTEVSWEKKGTWNAGIEATMFDRFLSFSVEYYNSKTHDMLLEYPLPLSTGFSGYDANIGSMSNQGFEATFNFNWADRKNFSARSTVMLYKNWNKVLALTKDDKITSGYQVIEVGKPIYTYYMPKNAGVDPATGAQLYWAYKTDEETGEKIEGSDFITSNKTLATNSRYYMGSREPDLQGSFASDFRFGPVDFSFLTTFSIGGKTYDSLYAGLMEVTYTGDTWSKNVLRRWQKPGDVTDVPAVMVNSGRLGTDRNLIDASYFAIKSVQLGYTLPEKWTKAARIKALRIFVNADNVAMFNHLNGLNVQYNFAGGTGYTYTPTRVMSCGIDINF